MNEIDVLKNGGITFEPPTLFSLRDFYRKTVKQGGQFFFIVSAVKNITRLLSHIVLVFYFEDEKHNGGRYAKYFKEDLIKTLLEKFYSEHIKLISSIFREVDLKKATEDFEQIFSELKTSVSLLKEGDNIDKRYPFILKYGELASASIFANFLRSMGLSCKLINAQDHLTTTSSYENAQILKLDNSFINYLSEAETFVTHGFIGKNQNGEDTTFGYDGSDLSAAYFLRGLIRAGIKARLTYCKNVGRFYLQDPFINKEAESFLEMNLDQYRKLPSHPIRLDAVEYAFAEEVESIEMMCFLDPFAPKAKIFRG